MINWYKVYTQDFVPFGGLPNLPIYSDEAHVYWSGSLRINYCETLEIKLSHHIIHSEELDKYTYIPNPT